MSANALAGTPVAGGGAARAPDPLDGFLAVADAHPGRTAIRYGGRKLSYADLRARVREVAGRLGPGPGVVAVPATHSPGTVAALFGVWSAGGVYCPLDASFPAARRRAMLTAAGCRELFDPDPRPGEVTDLPGAAGAPVRDADRTGTGGPDDLAYILFTSGSTGEPKPVMTPRRAIAVATRSLRDLFDLTPADRVLQFASLNWDTCFEEIVPALSSGASLVLHDDAYRGSFPRFLRMIDSEQVTVLDLPTAFWHELVTHLREAGAPLPGCVRLVVIGGEAASPARLADWCTLRTGHARLVNTYGCTETTLVTHAVDLAGPRVTGPATTWHPDRPVPIGRALPHVLEWVTGEGELLIGGPSLAAGYRGLPGDTDARFGTAGGRRMFRTGDRVSRLPDGSLRFEGRLDGEIKIRGVRVDPAEVEAHIAGHPAVGAVAVTGVGVADHTALAAYVVARPGGGSDALAVSLVEYLRGRVPAHLIPSQVHMVPELVYTPTGKVDRRRMEEALP